MRLRRPSGTGLVPDSEGTLIPMTVCAGILDGLLHVLAVEHGAGDMEAKGDAGTQRGDSGTQGRGVTHVAGCRNTKVTRGRNGRDAGAQRTGYGDAGGGTRGVR
jgi:hypothetical protein